MNIPWYLSRSAGLSAYMVLYLVVILGLCIRTRGLDRLVARWRVTDIHIFLSLLLMGLVLLHAGALLWDGFIGYSLGDILLPFSTGYRTFWTAIGIVMAYLLFVVLLSFPARRWIGYRAWRGLHYGTFVAYLGALAHGMFTGTDSPLFWAQLVYGVTAASVLGLLLVRILAWRKREHAAIGKATLAAPGGGRGQARRLEQAAELARRAADARALRFSGAAAIVTGVLFVAAGLGPFGWRQSSDSDTAVSTANGAPPAAQAPPSSSQPQGFRDSFTGTSSQTQSGSTVDIRVRAAATGERAATVDVHLTLAPGARGRTTALANTLTLSDGGASFCSGQVERLDDGEMLATCLGSGPFAGQQLTLTLLFDGGFSGQVSGSLDAELTS